MRVQYPAMHHSAEIYVTTIVVADDSCICCAETMHMAGYGDALGFEKLADGIMCMAFLVCQLWVLVNL